MSVRFGFQGLDIARVRRASDAPPLMSTHDGVRRANVRHGLLEDHVLDVRLIGDAKDIRRLSNYGKLLPPPTEVDARLLQIAIGDLRSLFQLVSPAKKTSTASSIVVR